MFKIKKYSDSVKTRWDAYVLEKTDSHFFHMTSWKNVIEKTFNIEHLYLYAEDAGRIVGVLPLFWVKNIFLKKSLVSVPFAVYGGACADNLEIERSLVDYAKNVTVEEKLNYLELRYIDKRELGLKEKSLYYVFIADLPEDPEIFWKDMRKKARNILRKGIKGGLEIRQEPDEVDAFYNLFSVSQQNLGTPVLPRAMFSNIMEEYKDDVTIFSSFYNGKRVNSLMVFFYKDTVMPYYIGYNREFLSHSPNNFILWKLIEYSCEHKYKHYDVGRSRYGAGSYHFKKNMGITPEPLHYQFFLNLEKNLPNINPENKKFKFALDTWQKLPPSIATMLGPKLVKYFP